MLNRSVRRFATSPWQNPTTEKRVAITYTIYRENMALNLLPLRARYVQSGGALYLKQRGVILIEFLPREPNQYDPTKKTINPAHKRFFPFIPENIYDVVSQSQAPLEFKRGTGDETKILKMARSDGGQVWRLETFDKGVSVDKKEISLNPTEYYMASKLFEYSLPYLMGWYPLGDPKLAEASIAVDEPQDPFEA